MPDFEYRGPSPGAYPMLRDAYGVLAGTVTPGDVLEFGEAPDADWAAYEGGDENDDDRSEQGQGSGAGGEQHEDAGAGTDQDDDTAGTGQEEADQ